MSFSSFIEAENKENSGRLIQVTHQIPYEITPYRTEEGLIWTFSPRHGHSAMYAGMESLTSKFETLRIGWTGSIDYKHLNDFTQDLSSSSDLYSSTTTTTNITSNGVNNNDNGLDQFTEEEKYDLVQQLFHQYKCLPLFLDNESVDGHYYGYCKTSKCK